MLCVLSHSVSLTLWDPMDCSLPAPLFMGNLQAEILEWVAVPFPRGSSQPRDWTQVSCISGGFFTIWATREDKTEMTEINEYNFIRKDLQVESHYNRVQVRIFLVFTIFKVDTKKKKCKFIKSRRVYSCKEPKIPCY